MELSKLIFFSNIILAFSSCPQKIDSSGYCINTSLLTIDNKICAAICPSEFITSPPVCQQKTTPRLFELCFYDEFVSLTDYYIPSYSDLQSNWNNPSNIWYLDSSKNSPLPTFDRGFYFAPTSSIISQSASYIVPSLYFTASFCIHQISPGTIMTVNMNSKNYIECIFKPNKISFNIISQNSCDSNETPLSLEYSGTFSYWYFLTFKIEQTNFETIQLSILKDEVLIESQLFQGYEANFPNGNYAWTIGNPGNSFQGFLWWACARNDLQNGFNFAAPTISCVNSQYWDGIECQNCDSDCGGGSDWPWCVRKGCYDICYWIDCVNCDGYFMDLCTDGYVCDYLAETCNAVWDSVTCKSNRYLFGGVCLNACPYGFGDNCSPVTTPVIKADFTIGFEGIYDNILVTGTSADNYYFSNSPDSTDPLPVKARGLYFSPGSYLEAKVNLSHTFTIAMWIFPITGRYINFKVGGEDIVIIDSDGSFKLIMKQSGGGNCVCESVEPLTLIDSLWQSLSYSIKFFINSADNPDGTSKFFTYINGSEDKSCICPDSAFRPQAGGSLFIGSSSFRGFISYFELWQVTKESFGYMRDYETVCDNDHLDNCLWPCELRYYWDSVGKDCESCLASCSNGCIKVGTCNICDSELCLECSSFLPNSCIKCIDNNRSGSSCDCNSGFYEPSGQNICSPCYSGCSHCTGSLYNQCTSCISGKYYFSAAKTCLSQCPLGYIKSSSECLLSTKLIIDLNLNTLNGVVYDAASSVPVITGTSEQFYPDYEDDDPIGAYLRGFYFNGKSSVMRLPEYQTYKSPKLQIGPIFTISIWINIETENSAVISKNNISNNYSTVYAVILISGMPAIQLLINNSILLYMCQTSLITFEWSHVAFQINIDDNGYTVVTCYANSSPDPATNIGFGNFQDVSSNTVSLIGAQQISQSIGNYFQGFLYEIKIFNVVYSITLLSQTSCSENCSICLTNGSCIPNCKITEFWKGPEYNECSSCNSNCKNGCRDSRSSCSVCANALCDACMDFSTTDCNSCITNAYFENKSCICDVGYAFYNSTSCVPIPDGGYRGSDGLLYTCPNLCLTCESAFKCNTCVNHAKLYNKLCVCNDDYNGTISCNYVSFSVNLIVFSNDSLSLNFSDPLQDSLKINNTKISIEDDPKFTWNLEQINNTYYYISMAIKEEIPQDAIVTVSFLDLSEVKSIWNGMLNSSTISSKLNRYDPNPYGLVVSELASKVSTIVQSTVIGSVILSILNQNPSSLWSLVNCLQILSYLSLSGIPFSAKMNQFLSGLNSYNFFPNFFENLIDEKEGNEAYKEAKNSGYNSDLILLNQGDDFSIIITSIVLYPFIIYFTGCSYRFFGKRFKKVLISYKYSFYIRFWIQCYLELTAAAGVGIVMLKGNNLVQIANLIICFLLYLISTSTPAVLFWFFYNNRINIYQSKGKFKHLFGSLFYEFQVKKGFRYYLYYFVYFLRRFIYITNLVFLSDYPKTQVALNIICSLMSIFYLLVYFPFKDKIMQISNLISEILIGFVMCSTSFYLFDISSEVIFGVENTIIFISMIVIGTQFSASASIFSRNFYQIFRQKFRKYRNKRHGVHPINISL